MNLLKTAIILLFLSVLARVEEYSNNGHKSVYEPSGAAYLG